MRDNPKDGCEKDGMITARQASAYWDTGVAPGASIGQTGRIKGVYKILNIKYDAYAAVSVFRIYEQALPGSLQGTWSPSDDFRFGGSTGQDCL